MTKTKTKVLILMLLCLMLVPAVTVNAGFQRQPNGKYRYYTSKKNYRKGLYVKGKFINIRKGKKVYTYYFDPQNGYMVTGWKQLNVKMKKNGKSQMVKSWYYFDPNGRMFKNRTKNGHYLKSDGRMAVNELIKGVYYGSDGSAVPGFKKEGTFVKTGKGTRYLQPDGTYAAKTWKCLKDGGRRYWFYFYSTGYMAKDRWLGEKYVDKYGHWIPDKKKNDSENQIELQ